MMMSGWMVLLLLVLVSGCASPTGTISSAYRLGDGDTSVVIGRMEVMRAPDSRSVTVTDRLKGRGVLLVMHQEADGSEMPYPIKTIEKDYGSDFYVALPPRGVVYIGTLRWNDGGRDGFFSRRGRWSLHDELDEVATRFHARYPAIDAVVTRALITASPPSGVSASP